MRVIPPSELIINADGSVFHLHLKPGQLSDKIILVGDPERVSSVASRFDSIECEVSNREFHSITGFFQGKRISVVSHGIGTDNIDIVLNELDALVNIDFTSRTVKEIFTQLTLVRIGTSGGLQHFVPVGTYVAAERSIGFDGVLYFYANNKNTRDVAFEEELLRQLDWKISEIRPYVVAADKSLIEQITSNDILKGVTIAANGFYGPQGRELRLPLADPELNKKIELFNYNGAQITNFEMESSAINGLSRLLGHDSLTICAIIANRVIKDATKDYRPAISLLIQKTLDKLATI